MHIYVYMSSVDDVQQADRALMRGKQGVSRELTSSDTECQHGVQNNAMRGRVGSMSGAVSSTMLCVHCRM